jgi:hypothetical protein
LLSKFDLTVFDLCSGSGLTDKSLTADPVEDDEDIEFSDTAAPLSGLVSLPLPEQPYPIDIWNGT